MGSSEASTPSLTSALEARRQADGLGQAQDGTEGDKIMSIVLPMDSLLSDGASNRPAVPCDTRDAFSLDAKSAEDDHEEDGGRVVSPTIEERRDEEEKKEEGSLASKGVVVTAPSTPTRAVAGGPNSTFIAASTASLRLHCRLCACEPCVDLTATMCGHVFCYKCVHCLLLWFLTFDTTMLGVSRRKL